MRNNFVPVSLKNGCCPNPEWHFRGASREVYSYLKLLAARHGGFVFASIGNIAQHTKNWKDKPRTYSGRQCKRIIKAFRALGILSDRRTVTIHGRVYEGWQFVEHNWWAENCGHFCDFKRWAEYEALFQRHKEQSVTLDVTDDVTDGVPRNGQNVTLGVTPRSDTLAYNFPIPEPLQASGVS